VTERPEVPLSHSNLIRGRTRRCVLWAGRRGASRLAAVPDGAITVAQRSPEKVVRRRESEAASAPRAGPKHEPARSAAGIKFGICDRGTSGRSFTLSSFSQAVIGHPAASR